MDKEVRAIKKIKKGEEVLADYIANYDFNTYLVRKHKLSKEWNFECACSKCTTDHATDDTTRRNLKRLHDEIPYYNRNLELESAINAAYEKCLILENCEYLVSLLPMAYLELYETVVCAKQYTDIRRLRLFPTFEQDYEQYREKALEMTKKIKLVNKKEQYNITMKKVARFGCFRELID